MYQTYSEASIVVDGRRTAYLEIFRKGNVFSIYEHDENVFSYPSYIKAREFVDKWVDSYKELINYMETAGMTVKVNRGCFDR